MQSAFNWSTYYTCTRTLEALSVSSGALDPAQFFSGGIVMTNVKLAAAAAVEAPQSSGRRLFLKRTSLGSVAIASSAVFGGLLKAASATTTSEARKSGG